MPIPSPPPDVLALSSNYTEQVYLVLFFDAKRTWQWLPPEKLELLGINTERDESKVILYNCFISISMNGIIITGKRAQETGRSKSGKKGVRKCFAAFIANRGSTGK